MAGDRHAVYRVSYRDAVGVANDVVVRVSTSDDPAERRQAELEAAVLTSLDGTGAPRLYDFRGESAWFDAPAMCMQFIDGEQRDVRRAPLGEIERFGVVIAAVHGRPVDGLVDWFPAAATIMAYADDRLAQIASYRLRLRDPLPPFVGPRVDGAFAALTATVERARRTDIFLTDERTVLLHGDPGAGNILWSPEPVLIDWEYARLGDPSDEIAYIFGQHGFAAPQRAAFWAGYRKASTHPQFEHLVERARWWEPVTLLGSALWWLERWSRRANAEASTTADPAVPKSQSYYLDHALRRLDRFDATIEEGLDS